MYTFVPTKPKIACISALDVSKALLGSPTWPIQPFPALAHSQQPVTRNQHEVTTEKECKQNSSSCHRDVDSFVQGLVINRTRLQANCDVIDSVLRPQKGPEACRLIRV